jgi:hypothetical protein
MSKHFMKEHVSVIYPTEERIVLCIILVLNQGIIMNHVIVLTPAVRLRLF